MSTIVYSATEMSDPEERLNEIEAEISRRKVGAPDRNLAIDGPDGVFQILREIFDSPESKNQDRVRAIQLYAELKGFFQNKHYSDIKRLPTEELLGLIEGIVLPALEPYGIRDLTADEDTLPPGWESTDWEDEEFFQKSRRDFRRIRKFLLTHFPD